MHLNANGNFLIDITREFSYSSVRYVQITPI